VTRISKRRRIRKGTYRFTPQDRVEVASLSELGPLINAES